MTESRASPRHHHSCQHTGMRAGAEEDTQDVFVFTLMCCCCHLSFLSGPRSLAPSTVL